MPSPRPHHHNHHRAAARSSSFHARTSGGATAEKEILRRPRTVPDLKSGTGGVVTAAERPKLTKVLLHVTVQGSVGPVQVLISPELSVADLISAALKQYVKEGRRPVINVDFKRLHGGVGVGDEFDLHYSQFSLESLDREEKLATLGSRNFFLCKRKAAADGEVNGVPATSCSKQAEKAATKLGSPCPWLKFMSFLF